MLTKRIIPCLDTRDGRVVKGIRFSNIRDIGDPACLAEEYERQGADEIVLLDISATPEERNHALHTVERVRQKLQIPLTIGGGVRTVDDVQNLLSSGADKVSINTAAVVNPSIINEMSSRFGCQCTVLALDARRQAGGWEVVTNSGSKGTGLDAVEWAASAAARGCGEILLTSWDKDGTRSGYDLELISVISMHVNVPVIASGGAASPEHLVEAVSAGADAVLAASIFHDGDYTVLELKQFMKQKGVQVRL